MLESVYKHLPIFIVSYKTCLVLNAHCLTEMKGQYTNLYKLVYNGRFSDFELPLLIRNSITQSHTEFTQILHCLSYKLQSTFITKFGTIELFVLILDISASIQQWPYYYAVTTSKIGFSRFLKNAIAP